MRNKFTINGDITLVHLSSREGIVMSEIDTKSLEILNEFEGTFRAVWNDRTKSYYAQGYDRPNGKEINVMMHRFLMNTPDSLVVDHINHDTLNNKLKNLRSVTQSINMLNPDPSKKNYKIVGIRWYEEKKKFRVRIRHQGIMKHLGYFTNFEDAEKVVREFRVMQNTG